MKYVWPSITAVLLCIVVWNNMQIASLKQAATPAPVAQPAEHAPEHEAYEVAIVMGRMHLYFDKLWFAGKAQNWELAGFYAHEIEESLEELIEAKVVEDGVEISKLAEIMTESPFKELEGAVKKQALPDFEAAYTRMVNTCNQCHQTTKHGFIRIQRPERAVFSSQVFEAAK
jgi:hypothetical protein